MDDCVRDMARQRYGFGRWEAPCWFIGLEEGMAQDENDDLIPRVNAWRALGGGELNDCAQVHNNICERRPLMSPLMPIARRSVDTKRSGLLPDKTSHKPWAQQRVLDRVRRKTSPASDSSVITG
jgi:hypothetical protein